eukprot:8718954-Heterocapsa_arctica.AAC.1
MNSSCQSWRRSAASAAESAEDSRLRGRTGVEGAPAWAADGCPALAPSTRGDALESVLTAGLLGRAL